MVVVVVVFVERTLIRNFLQLRHPVLDFFDVLRFAPFATMVLVIG